MVLSFNAAVSSETPLSRTVSNFPVKLCFAEQTHFGCKSLSLATCESTVKKLFQNQCTSHGMWEAYGLCSYMSYGVWITYIQSLKSRNIIHWAALDQCKTTVSDTICWWLINQEWLPWIPTDLVRPIPSMEIGLPRWIAHDSKNTQISPCVNLYHDQYACACCDRLLLYHVRYFS
jgi:hypothetical protein